MNKESDHVSKSLFTSYTLTNESASFTKQRKSAHVSKSLFTSYVGFKFNPFHPKDVL